MERKETLITQGPVDTERKFMFLPSGTFWIRLTSHRVAGRFVERISWSSGGEKEMAFINVRKKGRRNR